MFRLRRRIVIVIATLFVCNAFARKECNTTDLIGDGCSETETCTAKSNVSDLGYCDCPSGFKRVSETVCKPEIATKSPPQPSSSSLVEYTSTNHLAAAITIPLFVIALVICAIYISYRYKFYSWVRNKINQRNPNYDEVMIGQDLDDDDPPLH